MATLTAKKPKKKKAKGGYFNGKTFYTAEKNTESETYPFRVTPTFDEQGFLQTFSLITEDLLKAKEALGLPATLNLPHDLAICTYNDSDPNVIAVGCQEMTFKVWNRVGKKVADENGFTPEQYEAYEALITFVESIREGFLKNRLKADAMIQKAIDEGITLVDKPITVAFKEFAKKFKANKAAKAKEVKAQLKIAAKSAKPKISKAA